FEAAGGLEQPIFFPFLVARGPGPAELSLAGVGGFVFTIWGRFKQPPRCMSRMRGALSGPSNNLKCGPSHNLKNVEVRLLRRKCTPSTAVSSTQRGDKRSNSSP